MQNRIKSFILGILLSVLLLIIASCEILETCPADKTWADWNDCRNYCGDCNHDKAESYTNGELIEVKCECF